MARVFISPFSRVPSLFLSFDVDGIPGVLEFVVTSATDRVSQRNLIRDRDEDQRGQ